MNHYFTNDNNLKSNKKLININFENQNISLYTDNGVFSKEHFDYGSKLLIKNFLKEDKKGRVLDLGCGYGVIGIILSSNKELFIDMVDVNLRAVELSKENLKLNNVENTNCFESNIYSNVEEKYDYIITNPPIRAGKEIIRKFLFEAADHLQEYGEVWFVMRKDHGVKSMIKELEKNYLIKIIDKDKGFYIVQLKKNKNLFKINWLIYKTLITLYIGNASLYGVALLKLRYRGEN